MRLVVLDVVRLRPDRVALDAERLGELPAHVPHPGGVLEPLAEEAQAGRVAQRPQELLPGVCLRVAPDRDVVEVSGRDAGGREAPCRRERRETGAVLDAVETLLFGRGDELAVDDERRGRVTVVGVETKDRGHGGTCYPLSLSALRWRRLRSS